MRLPRPRFTMRWMMLAVALLAVLSLVGREYWARWMHRGYPNAVQGNISASLGHGNEHVSGHPLPVAIHYDFRIAGPKPPPGTSFLVWAEVWLEDLETRHSRESYTFDAPLVVGGREAASGDFTWEAIAPRPGRYYLKGNASYRGADGVWHGMSGMSSQINVVAPGPAATTSTEETAKP